MQYNVFKGFELDTAENREISMNLALSAFGIFSVCAMITYFLDRDYSIVYNYLSDLGTGKFGWIMNLGLMITSILLFSVFFAIYAILNDFTTSQSTTYLRLATVTGILSQIGLFFVGYYPDQPGIDKHSYAAAVFFFFLMFTILFLTFVVHYIKDETVFNRLDNVIIKTVGYGLVLVDLLLIYYNIFNLDYVYLPLLQKIVVLSSFFFLGVFIALISLTYNSYLKTAHKIEYQLPIKARITNLIFGVSFIIASSYILIDEDFTITNSILILAALIFISGLLDIIDVFTEREIPMTKKLFEFTFGIVLVVFGFMIYYFSTFGETVLLTILAIAILVQGFERISLSLTHEAYPFWIKLTLVVVGFISIIIGMLTTISVVTFYTYSVTVVDLMIIAFIANGISLLLQGIIGLGKTKTVSS